MTFATRLLIQASSPRRDDRMLACSAHRRLCEDRKGFFDHLAPTKLAKSTVRVVVLQSSQVLTTFLQDQLEEDMKRDQKVQSQQLSREEAEKDAEEWNESEWNIRWSKFPHRLTVALVKYHSILFVMRAYEYVAAQMVDLVTLDKLTLDTYSDAKREPNRPTRDLVSTNAYANVIAFLADYSVHQILLLAGYYAYTRERRNVHYGSLTLSVSFNSASLALSRVIGWIMASLGGAVGTVVWPGWGTLIGTNVMDSIASSLTEGMTSGAPM